MTIAESARQRTGPYQLFMLGLCIYALGILSVETLAPLDQRTRQILVYADVGVCGLFFLDFWISLVKAPDRWRYLSRWGWIDLLSSIPAIPILRLGRAARILRVLRLLRGVRAIKILSTFVLDRRSESGFLAAALLSFLLVVFGSIAVLQFESTAESNIKTAQDAVWWAFVTITTVGYGDRFPVTSEGRIVGALLMTAGVGLFGTFAGFVASWFLAPVRRKERSEIQDLREEVAAIRRMLEGSTRSGLPARSGE